MSRSATESADNTTDLKTRPKIKRRKGELKAHHFRDWSVRNKKTGCWEWQRAIAWNGYGVLRDKKKTVRAHRKSYELHNGVSVPRTIDVCHSCDNRKCVNPDHLFVGTRKANMQDCKRKGRIKIPNLQGNQLPHAKLNPDLVIYIRSSQKSQRVLAKELGVSRRAISFVQKRKTWVHV